VNHAETIKRLQTAKDDPEKLTLATVDIVTAQEPSLRTALEVAAVPHWFDTRILSQLLEAEETTASQWVDQLRSLPMVEAFPAHNGWNVHETTRLALRNWLRRQEPERLEKLSAKASKCLAGADPARVVEAIYHNLLASPDEAADELERVRSEWSNAGRYESLQILGVALRELLTPGFLSPVARARSLLSFVLIRRGELPLAESERMARESVDLFQQVGSCIGEVDARDLLGDILRVRGQLEEALSEFKKWQQIVTRWRKQEPDNPHWQRELSVSHGKIADILLAQGKGPSALLEYEAARNIRVELTKLETDNTAWLHDLSISCSKLGECLKSLGRLPEATREIEASKQIMLQLTAADPENSVWQRHLSISHNKLGNILRAQDQLVEAMHEFEEGKRILQRLVSRDPQNTDWQRDLSVAHNSIGNVFHSQVKLENALQEYKCFKSLMQQLAESDPENTTWQRDLAVAHGNIGRVLEAQNQPNGAISEFEAEKAIMQDLLARNQENASWLRGLSIAHNHLGRVLEGQGRLAQALTEYEADLKIARQLAAQDSSNIRWQQDLAVTLADVKRVSGQVRGDDGFDLKTPA